jgi:hypothetical protein
MQFLVGYRNIPRIRVIRNLRITLDKTNTAILRRNRIRLRRRLIPTKSIGIRSGSHREGCPERREPLFAKGSVRFMFVVCRVTHALLQSMNSFLVAGWHFGQKKTSYPLTPSLRIVVPQRGHGSPFLLRTFMWSRTFTWIGWPAFSTSFIPQRMTETIDPCTRSSSSLVNLPTNVFG